MDVSLLKIMYISSINLYISIS